MRAIKKINNNVAICIDNNQDELVAFGKGIGFPAMPYEITDLSQITMTFYRLNSHNFQLLKEIPSEIFEVSAQIVQQSQQILNGELNPNVIFGLADHLNFAIIRLKKKQQFDYPFSYDLKNFYPQEFQVGEIALTIVKKRLHVILPKSEATAIAMHFLNSQVTDQTDLDQDVFQKLTEQTLVIIQRFFPKNFDPNDFTYNRFILHLHYYLRRLKNNQQISKKTDAAVVRTFKANSPKIYRCTQEIVTNIDEQLHTLTTDDEMFYLMIYVQRLVDQTTDN